MILLKAWENENGKMKIRNKPYGLTERFGNVRNDFFA
jgi:hypothetical protein